LTRLRFIPSTSYNFTTRHICRNISVIIYIVTCLVTVDGVLDCQLDLLGSNTQLHTITAESLRTLPLLTLQPSSALRTLSLLSSESLLSSLSEIYDIWTHCREDTAFGIAGCLAITRKRVPSGLGLTRYQATSTPRRARHTMYIYAQSVPGGKVNILGGHSIGHSRKKFI
jgi:hypothetical protein